MPIVSSFATKQIVYDSTTALLWYKTYYQVGDRVVHCPEKYIIP